MKNFVWVAMVLTTGLLSACAGEEHLLTATVYDSPKQVVRLQAIANASQGQGYSHPAFLSEEKVARILEGLRVEKNTSLVPLAFQRGKGKTQSIPAFSEGEVRFLAPLLAKGLAMATPEELVTFFETADISSTQRVITSGGVLVRGDEFYIVLGNHLVKKNIWIDAEYYESPFRLRPLRPIEHGTEPGRLLFEPSQYMIETKTDAIGLRELTTGLHLHVAVRYRELPLESLSGTPTPTR